MNRSQLEHLATLVVVVVVVIYFKSVSDVQLFARESIFKPIIEISFKTFENITNRLTNGTDFIGPYSP